MPEVDPVILQLRADLRDYQSKVERAERLSSRKFDEIQRGSESMSRGVQRGFSLAAKAALTYVGVLGAVGIAREYLRIADSAKLVEAQLKLATRESGNFTQAQEDVRRIAISTRTELGATAQLYSTFQRNARELGITQEQSARATETVTKAFRISGATAAEAAGGLRQFLQGLQSGALRGEELNSVLENAPRLARLLADSLGVTVGQLRAMGQEGDLAADKLIKALTDRQFTKQIDDEFRELPVTFGEALQNIENAATITFGAFDRGGQFSQALVNFIEGGTDGFADLEQAALDFGITARSSIEGLATAFDPVFDAGQRLFSFLESGMGNLQFDVERELQDLDNLTGWLSRQGLAGRLITGGSFDDWWNERPAQGTDFAGRYRAGRDAAAVDLRRDAGQTPVSRALARLSEGNNRAGIGPPPARPPSSPGRSSPSGRSSQRSAEAAARRAETERLRGIREEASKRQDEARLQDDLLAAKAALATATEDILAFEMQMIESDKAQRLDQLQTDVRLGNLSQEEADERAKVVEATTELYKQRAQRAADEAMLNQQIDEAADQADTLRLESRLARNREDRLAIEQRILDKEYEREELAIRQAAANGQIADLDEALANLRRRRLAEEELLTRSNLSPGGQYLEGLQNEAENLADAYEAIAVRGLEQMNRGLADSVKNALGLHGVLGNIIGDFIELAFRQQVLLPLLGGGGGGGGGGLFGTALSIFGGGRASGGPVSAGQTYLVGENGPELLRMGSQPGFVVPNHQITRGGGGGGMATVRLELSGDIDARIQRVSGPVAVEVVRASAPSVIDAAAKETLSRARRPGL